MKKILITGATGNIGSEVIRYLFSNNTVHSIIAGVRNIENSKAFFTNYPQLEYRKFDFEDYSTFNSALDDIDTIFILRPPHISDISKYFAPLINKIKEKNITEIIFLSVQGAEKSSVIPHNKIEKLILESGINYIFLRPSYFMQNLTTTLLHDIQKNKQITLPAGNAKFNWIDIQNIGEACAIILENFEKHANKAIEITGYENKSFYELIDITNTILDKPITYTSVSLIKFYRIKKHEKMNTGMIIVMALLHYLPRFQKEPKISYVYEELTGKKPTDLQTFITREKNLFNLSSI